MLRKFGLLFAVIGAFGVGDIATTDTASASSVYNFDVELNTFGSAQTLSYVYKLDTTKATTIRIVRLGAQVQRLEYLAGNSSQFTTFTIQPGDVIQAYQPAADAANPPVATPKDTFTVPNLTLNVANGSGNVSGAAEDGSSVRVQRNVTCFGRGDSIATTRSPGAYTGAFSEPAAPGGRFTAVDMQPDGDRTYRSAQTGGETPCLRIDATDQSNPAGGPGPPYKPGFPYRHYLSDLYDATLMGVRAVVRRGGTAISDSTEPFMTTYKQTDLTPGEKPLPGDTIDIYRPAAAGSPSYSWTIPQLSAVFDASADLVAVNGPPANSIFANACRAQDCSGNVQHFAVNTRNGRTLISFKKPIPNDAVPAGGPSLTGDAYDMLPDDQVSVNWTSPDRRFAYGFSAVPGDLVAPAGKLRAAKRLKLRGRHKPKIKVTSNEAGKVKLKLTYKKRKRNVTLASASGKLKNGTTVLKLRVSRSGKRLHRGVKAKLTATLTDASGNASTVVKTVKVKG